ncbi:MAG: RDD family protein [Chitinophagaceae bacterium]
MEESSAPIDLLYDVEDELRLEPASTGQRFINFIVDYIIAIGVYYGIIFLLAVIGAVDENSLLLTPFVNLLFSVVIMVFTYTLIEFLSKGKSLGKLITKTRAVKNNGSHLTFKDALLRSLIRFVPFEPFSGFGIYTWHDQWTDTMVSKEQ